MSSNSEVGVKPEAFHGDRAKSKDFKTRVRMFLRANSTKYANDGAKIALFLGLCQGDVAGVWASQREDEILSDDDAQEAYNAAIAA
ncbi:hypothetical protein DENSPDRAFT_790036, partial [Dentipellis sp. KUC8613]